MLHSARLLALGVLVSSLAWAQAESRWPGAPRFGIRSGMTGSTGTSGIDVGNVGMKALLNDQIGLTLDLGLGLTTGGGTRLTSFALGAGTMFYLLDTQRSLRPYIPLHLSFGLVSSRQNGMESGASRAFQLAVAGGVGAEYFFSKQFSMAAEMTLRMYVESVDPVSISLNTVSPGVHATYYF